MSLRGETAVLRLEELQEAWDAFCEDVLAEPGHPGMYKGVNVIMHRAGDAFMSFITEYVDDL